MNILVLGSEGQIGKPLCSYLESKGHHIQKYDKALEKSMDLSVSQCNRMLYEEMKKADKIIFLAFVVGGSKFMQAKDNSIEYISENVKLMDNTFSMLVKADKPFLFASSQMSNMFNTNYGFLKNLGERYTKLTTTGWICKFWNVYGPEDPNDIRSHVITDFIHMAKTKGKITMKTNGWEERQFLHALDCSKAIETWVEDKWDDIHKEYDITSFFWNRIVDVATTVQSLIPCEIETGDEVSLQQIKNFPNDYILKFWKPEINLTSGIKTLI